MTLTSWCEVLLPCPFKNWSYDSENKNYLSIFVFQKVIWYLYHRFLGYAYGFEKETNVTLKKIFVNIFVAIDLKNRKKIARPSTRQSFVW